MDVVDGCLQMFTNAYKYLQMFTDVYKCLQMFTNVYMFTCLQMFTNVYMFITVVGGGGGGDGGGICLVSRSRDLVPRLCHTQTMCLMCLKIEAQTSDLIICLPIFLQFDCSIEFLLFKCCFLIG